MKRIGIFGGSFDPIHSGHLAIALQALDEAGLDKVIFMPARVSPFKLDRNPVDGKMRFEMIRESIAGINGLEVSDYEINLNEVSYTVYTLRHLKKVYGDDTIIYFMTGTDAFLTLDKWYMADEMLGSYNFIIGVRPGYKDKELDDKIVEIQRKFPCDIIKLHNKEHDISSSEIRERVVKGLDIKGLVPDAAERYINEQGLYQ